MHNVVFQFPRCALRSRAQRTAPNESIRDHNVVPRLSRAIALRMVPRRNVERESTFQVGLNRGSCSSQVIKKGSGKFLCDFDHINVVKLNTFQLNE